MISTMNKVNIPLRKILKKKEKEVKQKNFYTANEIKDMVLKEKSLPTATGKNSNEFWWFER